MAFSQDIRSSGNFQELFGKLRRRVNRNEVSKDDYATLQRHVNNMRTQIDWASAYHITDNLESNPIGPNDFVFEPDLSEVMLYQPFANVYGDGRVLNKTLNSVAYDVIDIGDSTLIPSTVSTGTYHYQPYGTFNGIDQYVQVPDSSALRLTQWSIACWFRTSNQFPFDTANIVSKGLFFIETAGQNINYEIVMIEGGELVAGFETSAGVLHSVISPLTYNDGQWHYAVATYDQVTIRLYVDGAEVNNTASTATPDTGATDLFIAIEDPTAAVGFQGIYEGDIDEVYVWNNDLTAGEVSALYSAGTVPQTSAIVYQNNFGGFSNTTAFKKAYYGVLNGTSSWDWNVGHHPTSMKNENSLALNVGTQANQQILYYDEFGTDFDFTTNNLSFGFWIYPTTLPTTSNHFIMQRRINSTNRIAMEIDDADDKLFVQLTIGGSTVKEQYDTALTTDNWYYVNTTCEFAGPTVNLKVNDNAGIVSTKSIGAASFDDKLYFGGYPGLTQVRFFQGYLAFPMWYKHSTVLTTGERTSLYNYNTKTSTTEPAIGGYAQAG